MNKKIIIGIAALALLLVSFVYIAQLSLKSVANTQFNISNPNNHLVTDSVKEPKQYQDFLNDVLTQKKFFTDTDSAKQFLFELFNNNIPQYWIGTKWDFNGTTRVPQVGAIACGYFITNTLKDVGFDIQRIKLAQAPSSEMINKLCVNIKRVSNLDKLQSYIKQQPDNSIFIIGLDFHTGYILKSKNEIYFLHSNYINEQGVIKEKSQYSLALKSSKSFMIGNLSENTALIKKWIKY